MRTSSIAALAATLAILVAGCASAGASGPGAADGAATVVPADATAFVAASTDLTSSQWHGLGSTLLKQLPGWATALAPSAGGELDVAVLHDGTTVALLQPTDAAAVSAAVAKRGGVSRAIDGWTVVARDAAALDAVAAAKAHLAGSNLFVQAMNRLPGKALVRAYASGADAQRLLASIPGQLESRQVPLGVRYRQTPQSQQSAVGVATQQFRWLAGAVTSTGDGLALNVYAPAGDLTAPRPPRLAVKPIAPYAPALVDEIPAGVLAAVDVQVPPGAFELLPSLPAPLAKAFGANAFAVPNELDTVLGGETALYVRAALPTPEVTLVTQPADTAAASGALDSLLAALPKTGPLSGLALHRAVIGGQLVVSTTQKGIDDFRAGGAKLSADPAFLAARKQAGMPEQTTGFAYVNVKDALPLAALAGAKPPAGLPDVRSFLAYGSQTGDESGLTAFLGVG